MNEKNLNNEERKFIEEHVEDLIEVFSTSHEELKSWLKTLDDNIIKEYFDSNIQYEFFMNEAKIVYSYGYCFDFVKILKPLFLNSSFIFNKEKNHVLLDCDKFIIDINGVYYKDNNSNAELKKYIDADDEMIKYASLKFNSLNDIVYSKLKSIFYKNLKDYLKVSMSFEEYINKK